MKLESESQTQSHLLKQPDDKRYLSLEENLELLGTVPIPDEEKDSEIVAPPKVEPVAPVVPEHLEGVHPVVELEGRAIDLNPADNGSKKTQDQWIDYFNDRNEIMVSMHDLYLVGKSNHQKLLESLRNNFENGWVVSSTRIKYENKNNARIIHNYGSKMKNPIEKKIIIPEYRKISLYDVFGTNEGLRFLQVLFGTNDDVPQIKDTLQNLSNYGASHIEVWSPTSLARPAEMVAGLSCRYNRFHIGGDADISNESYSRAVHLPFGDLKRDILSKLFRRRK